MRNNFAVLPLRISSMAIMVCKMNVVDWGASATVCCFDQAILLIFFEEKFHVLACLRDEVEVNGLGFSYR
jgi:hypothetical protein